VILLWLLAACGPTVQRHAEHGGWAAIFSRDGRTVLVGRASGREGRIIDARAGAVRCTMSAYSARALDLSGDGRHFLFADTAGDVATCAKTRLHEPFLAFQQTLSDDGARVAELRFEDEHPWFQVRDLGQDEPLARMPFEPKDIAWAPDGSTVCGVDGGNPDVACLDVRSGDPLWRWNLGDVATWAHEPLVAVNEDGSLVATSLGDDATWLFDRASGVPRGVLEPGRIDEVTALGFAASDPRRLAVGYRSGTIRVFDAGGSVLAQRSWNDAARWRPLMLFDIELGRLLGQRGARAVHAVALGSDLVLRAVYRDGLYAWPLDELRVESVEPPEGVPDP